MSEQIETESVLKYLWIKGGKVGKVEIFKEELEENEIRWTYFENGTRIKSELVNEFLRIVTDEELENDPIHGISKDIENSTDPLHSLNPTIPTEFGGNPNPVSVEKSPIRQLLEKQANKNLEPIELVIELPIPKKGIYEVIRDSYEEAEVDKELKAMLLDNISTSEANEQLEKAVLKLIEKYYSIKIKEDEQDGEESGKD